MKLTFRFYLNTIICTVGARVHVHPEECGSSVTYGYVDIDNLIWSTIISIPHLL